MTLQPANAAELCANIAAAIGPVGPVDLGRMNRLLAHVPEDMTATVEAGMSLADFQARLAQHSQWLPLDPPHPEKLTIGELISQNPSGPRRRGFGTIRDHLIGLTVVSAEGRLVHSGGKVVKNVAGYDLMKLFIGARGSLGVVVEATFKLLPLPEDEQFVCAHCGTVEEAESLISRVVDSPLVPVVFDLHSPGGSQVHTVVLGFAGMHEDVAWQLAQAAELGFRETTTLEYEAKFHEPTEPCRRISVLPSKLAAAVRGLNGAAYVARAGNGIIYHRGADVPSSGIAPGELIRRIKQAFDPKNIFPAPPL